MDLRLKGRIGKISTLIFDVDGVFTDGTIIVTDIDVQRVFNVKDGYAVQMALKAGYKMAVISGGKQESIRTRLGGLGIPEIHLSVSTDGKPAVLDSLLAKWELEEEEVLYIGDDIPDLLLMKGRKIFKACPVDARPEVLDQADFICPSKGGHGAVRDVIELVMKTQDTWMKQY
ncbi:KdsC family phosphatase [Jiulongibacter sediminis]|uniref:3-deoxy-D-manno-octulosonate 8-phosphate phosphatase n=1 Tax=Jiulongibacter sediminis TaxID=1605367 RepID=A0A0P7C0D1_9BACT|nr:HAD hydrolase-like protein [Jiulongibacter sediminis]KPM48013.1 3-deoxy-D-manno-octulosonate 8-phosphate phosphatase [Jiulongibacter sediminis]TBX24195.1 3-deoxy-D-manno-octulosonate 8-phosphate phosphatase [Jiulongibacter sediminis]